MAPAARYDTVGQPARQFFVRSFHDRPYRRRSGLARPAEERPRAAKSWIVFGASALAAACINPYGPEILLANVHTLSLGQALSVINEWRPQNFSHLDPYEIILLAAVGFALLCGVRLPPFRIVMLLGVLHLSLSQSRHADLLGILAPLFVARPLAAQFSALAADAAGAARIGLSKLLFGAGMLAVVLIGGAIGALGHLRPRQHHARRRGQHHLRGKIGVRSSTATNSAAISILVGNTTFIDGRTETLRRTISCCAITAGSCWRTFRTS